MKVKAKRRKVGAEPLKFEPEPRRLATRLWYTQAGTPKIEVIENFEGDTLTITFTQTNPNTPGQKDKKYRGRPEGISRSCSTQGPMGALW